MNKPTDIDRIGTGSGNGGNEPPAIDPIIGGLLKRLPKSGDVWPEVERKLWLQLLEGSFKLIYKDQSPSSSTKPLPPTPNGNERGRQLMGGWPINRNLFVRLSESSLDTAVRSVAHPPFRAMLILHYCTNPRLNRRGFF